MSTNPYSHSPTSSGKSFQKNANYYNRKRGLPLEWDVQKTHTDSTTFGHIVYMSGITNRLLCDDQSELLGIFNSDFYTDGRHWCDFMVLYENETYVKRMTDLNFTCLVDEPKPGFKMAPSKWEEVDGAALEAQGIYKDFLKSIFISSFVFFVTKILYCLIYSCNYIKVGNLWFAWGIWEKWWEVKICT